MFFITAVDTGVYFGVSSGKVNYPDFFSGDIQHMCCTNPLRASMKPIFHVSFWHCISVPLPKSKSSGVGCTKEMDLYFHAL